MIIGFLTEDQGSIGAWEPLWAKLPGEHTFFGPLHAQIQPKASPSAIAKASVKALKQLRERNVNLVVVMLDMEDRTECVGDWRDLLEIEFARVARQVGIPEIKVVLKASCLENWLISDPAAHPVKSRYHLSKTVAKPIQAGSADTVDAQSVLKSICKRPPYSKSSEPAKILAKNDPFRMASNSRSFRRLLRVLSIPPYTAQSRISMQQAPTIGSQS